MALADLINQYNTNIKAAGSNFQALNPQQIQAAISQGGALSGSLGFNSPTELLGLTPEGFDKLIENRTAIMNENLKQVAGAINLRDQLYGISEGRRAAQQQAQDIFQAGTRMEEREFTEKKEAERQAASFAQQDKWNQLELEIKQSQLKADQAYREASLAQQRLEEAGRNRRATAENEIRLREARARTEEARIFKEQTRLDNLEKFKQVTYEKLGTLKDRAIAKMQKKETKTAGRKEFLTYSMQQESLGRTPGEIFDTKGYEKEAGGYPQLRLDDKGNWYGMKVENGKRVYSPTPIIPAPVGISRE